MQIDSPGLNFPTTFCCNCGDINCMAEIQDTRVTRYFGFGGVETTFQLPIPICTVCRRTTRRRPSGLFARALIWAIVTGVAFGLLIAWGESTVLPLWMSEHLLAISAGLALLLVTIFYRFRQPSPPQTSFYQPVRVKEASVQVGDGSGQVTFMKLAFTNHEYLNVFATANREAIESRRLAAVKA
jgi:hypothetical protein